MKILRKNILGFILGGIIFGGVSYIIASQILAIQVSYTNEKSEANVTNVDGALTELYGLAEECQNASSSGSGVTYYGKDAVAVYLDPKGTQTNCSESNYSSTTSTGCFRFYVYAEDSEYKYAILDHNTTATVSSGFYAAQSQVKQDTASWNPNLQARNISAMEVYKITESTNNGGTNWQIKAGGEFFFVSGSNYSKLYDWLFDRTHGCTSFGCTTADSNVYGYWTSDFKDSSKSRAIHFEGKLSANETSVSGFGVRPVIKIAK